MIIVPTIFEKDPLLAEARWEQIKETTRWVQVDVIDGVYGKGKSFDLELVKKIIPDQDKLVEIHLMVKEPISWINKCIEAGATRVVGQIEMMSDVGAFIKKATDEGLEAGLGWDAETDFDPKKVPEGTDLVLFMGRDAGFEAKDFDEKILEKVKLAKSSGLRVGWDGGINKAIENKLKLAGVDIAYVGANYLELANG